MGVFDFITNPLWNAIKKAPATRRMRLAQLLTTHAVYRTLIGEMLVRPLLTAASDRSAQLNSLLAKAGRPGNVQISNEDMHQLVHTAMMALLTCGFRHNPNEVLLQWIDAESLAWCVSFLEGLKDDGSSDAVTIDTAGYASDSDAARTQVLAKWMDILHVQNPIFIRLLNESYFERNWRGISQSALSGAALNVSRKPSSQVLVNAEQAARSYGGTAAKLGKILASLQVDGPNPCSTIRSFRQRVLDLAPPRNEAPAVSVHKTQSGQRTEGSDDLAIVTIVGADREIELPKVLVLMMWQIAQEKGWQGPLLWTAEENGGMTCRDVGNIMVSEVDAKSLANLLEERMQQVRSQDASAEEVPELTEFMALCRSGGFRVLGT